MKKQFLQLSLAAIVGLPASVPAQNLFAPQFAVAAPEDQFNFTYRGVTNSMAGYGMSVGPHWDGYGPVVGLSGRVGCGLFTSQQNRLWADIDGRIGIGTTAPQARLHVIGTGIFDEPGGAIRVPRARGSLSPNDLGIWKSSSAENDSTFAIAGWNGDRTGVFINTDTGNTGIGISTPRTRLHVNGALTVGSSHYDDAVKLGASGGDYGSVGYGWNPTSTSGEYTYANNDFASRMHFYKGGFRFETAPTGQQGANVPFSTAMEINQAGFVGIGTSSPATLLDVHGNLTLSSTGPQRTIETSPGTRMVISAGEDLYLQARNGGGSVIVRGTLSTPVLSLTSDRNVKQDFQPVSGKESAAKVATLPITTWRYTNSPVIHCGPMAQDFKAAFGLGEDDKHIGAGDAIGVALSAIQGLHQMVQEKDSEIAALKRELAGMKEELASVKDTVTDRLAALEKAMAKNVEQVNNVHPLPGLLPQENETAEAAR